MTPAPIDHTRSRANPRGLTAHQCYALRLVCKHGGTKQAWAATDTPLRTLEGHIIEIRKKLGMRGHDVRLYLEWDRWLRTVAESQRRSQKNL